MKKREEIGISPAALSALVKGDVGNFIIASTPGGIERQEAEGQASFVGMKDSLPIKCPREQLEKLGFKFGSPIDEHFISVIFPVGWSKRATDHSMWSELLDEQGRKRGSIFYKAAFYDRSAHMNLSTRFLTTTQYLNNDGTPFDWERSNGTNQPTKVRAIVKDSATEEILWSSETWNRGDKNWVEQDAHQAAARKYLTDNYPDFNNPLAYW